MTGPVPRHLVLVKHALPVLDPSRPPREWRLGAEGHEQARALAASLRRFLPFRLVSSTEPKASRTAEIIADALGLEMVAIDGLRELDRPALPIMPPDEHERFNARLFTALDEAVIGAESARAALDRFATAMRDLVEQASGQDLVVVAHGTVIALFTAAHTPVDALQLWKRLQCSGYVVLGLPSLELVDVVDSVSPSRVAHRCSP